VKTLPLAGGVLPALPTGNVFIRVIEFRQAVDSFFPSQQHVPGFIFQAAGSQLLAFQDGPTVNLGPAEAFFQGPLAHKHLNAGTTANHWYFIALWPTSARSAPLVTASAEVPYATPDLAPSAFPPGQYIETLRLLSLEPGGRTLAAKYGGIAVLFVLDGSINIHTGGKSRMVAQNQGVEVLPMTATQVFNQSSHRVTLLAFYITAAEQPFETTVARSP